MFEQRQDSRRSHLGEEAADLGLMDADGRGAKEALPGDQAAEQMYERHDRLMGHLKDERDRQAENRYQMAKDEDYFDGLQWEPEDAQALMDRGQAPLVFNKTKPTVEWVLGTEKRTRIDYKVLPREPSDEQGAEIKTKVLKYVSDTNRVPFHRSAAFQEAVVAGLGWLEDGVNRDPRAQLLFSGHESWRNIYRDSRGQDMTQEDWRFMFRQRTTDLDIALAMFPQARSQLDSDAQDDSRLGADAQDPWYLGERLTNGIESGNASRLRFGERSAFVSTASADTGRRDIVRLIECWYRVPEPVDFFANGPFAGKPFMPADANHMAAVQGGARTFQHITLRMRCMLATESAPLWDGPSPYRHDRFPFTPIWCYRRKRDGEPYGIVRGIRDIQDDLNKRRSKALFVLSTNRVIADSNAVEDLEELRREAARPDGVIVKRQGTSVELVKPTTEIQGNFELMQQDESMMQDISGVQSELLGRQTNATSGKAILARQEQGSMVTAGIFDNLRLGIQMQGEKQLALTEQFFSEEKVLRLVGANAPIEWIEVNKVDEATGQVINDITATQADFIVSEQDYRANLQQAAAEQIGDVLTKLAAFAPQVVNNVLDLWVDLLDVPNKDEFVKRIRSMTGQRDPSKAPTPEEQQAMAQAQKDQDEQRAIQKRQLLAQLADLEAKGDKTKAEAMRLRVQAMLDAINAGQVVTVSPSLAPVADEIMAGAGFQDQGGQDPALQQPAAPAAPAGMPPGGFAPTEAGVPA